MLILTTTADMPTKHSAPRFIHMLLRTCMDSRRIKAMDSPTCLTEPARLRALTTVPLDLSRLPMELTTLLHQLHMAQPRISRLCNFLDR